jgi:hypothetical protein
MVEQKNKRIKYFISVFENEQDWYSAIPYAMREYNAFLFCFGCCSELEARSTWLTFIDTDLCFGAMCSDSKH